MNFHTKSVNKGKLTNAFCSLMPRYAGFWERFAAHIIDNITIILSAIILGIIAGLLSWILKPIAAPLVGNYSALGIGFLVGILIYFVGPFIYFTYFIGKTGQTPGKYVMKIRVVDVRGQSTEYLRAFIRIVMIEILLAFVIPALVFLLIVFDRQKQGLHDKLLGTFVVKKT